MLKKYGYYKTIEIKDEETGETDVIKFKASAGLFPLYKSYFGTDLLNDIIVYAEKGTQLTKIKAIDTKNMTTEELMDAASRMSESKIDFDTTFLFNIVLAMRMNALADNDRIDVNEGAYDTIPPQILGDMNILQDLIGLILKYVQAQKKT